MIRPKSLTLLIFFAVWSAFKGFESLINPAGSKSLFDEYNVGLLYYLFVVITVLGGVGVAYAIVQRKVWGVKVGFVWLISGILYTLYTGIVSITNKDLMEQIMTATREAKGRPTDGIADYINSSGYDVTIIATTVVLTSIMMVFLWKLRQHKSYFNNTTMTV